MRRSSTGVITSSIKEEKPYGNSNISKNVNYDFVFDSNYYINNGFVLSNEEFERRVKIEGIVPSRNKK